jgi:hypothetical protein
VTDVGDLRPRPDPTILTTEQLQRAVVALENNFKMQLGGLRELLDARFDKVDQQFDLVERQRVEQKQDTKVAVDAALQAQKEAVREQTLASERAIAKSEAATTKQLEQLGTTFTTALGSTGVTLSDIKERVGRIESVKVGVQENTTHSQQSWGVAVAVASVVIALMAVVVAIVVAVVR